MGGEDICGTGRAISSRALRTPLSAIFVFCILYLHDPGGSCSTHLYFLYRDDAADVL